MEGTKEMGKLLTGKAKAGYLKSEISKAIYSSMIFLLGVIMLVPFVFMISASFKYNADVFTESMKIIPSRLNLGNYNNIFHNKDYLTWYLNSIILVVSLVTLRTIVVTLAAYAFAKLRFYGKEVIFILLLATLMVPADMTVISRFLELKLLGLTDSLLALIIPGMFDVFFLFLMRQHFMTLPNELMESAVIDGCSHLRIYYSIILPLSKPAVITLALFTFIWGWNDFVGPFIFITNIKHQVLTVGLQYFRGVAGDNTALQMAGACIGILPTIIGFTFVQKYFIQGIATSGIKG